MANYGDSPVPYNTSPTTTKDVQMGYVVATDEDTQTDDYLEITQERAEEEHIFGNFENVVGVIM